MVFTHCLQLESVRGNVRLLPRVKFNLKRENLARMVVLKSLNLALVVERFEFKLLGEALERVEGARNAIGS